MDRVKPLYRYAGGKAKLLTRYADLFKGLHPQHCVDYFGGSGSMSLWFHQLYPDAKLYLNEKDAAIYKLFRCMKEEYEEFCQALEHVEEDIDVLTEERQDEDPLMTWKRRYSILRNWLYNPIQEPTDSWEPTKEEIEECEAYISDSDRAYLQELYDKGLSEREIHNRWSQSVNGFTQDEWEEMSGQNTPSEHAWYYLLRKLSFSGVNQRNAKGEYNASAGIVRRNAPYTAPETLWTFKEMLNHATLFNVDYRELDIQRPKSLHYFDPPYVDASPNLYIWSFGWHETEELCTYIQRIAEHSTVFMSNYDHPRLRRMMQDFNWTTFPPVGVMNGKKKKDSRQEILFYKIHPSLLIK